MITSRERRERRLVRLPRARANVVRGSIGDLRPRHDLMRKSTCYSRCGRIFVHGNKGAVYGVLALMALRTARRQSLSVNAE